MASSRVISPRSRAAISATPMARITGASPANCLDNSAATSSTAPCSIIAAKRRSQRSYSQRRGGSSNSGLHSICPAIPPALSRRQSAKLRRLLRTTSSARFMRLSSLPCSTAAIAGSSDSKAAKASDVVIARTAPRTSGLISGTGAMPSSNVRRYSPVPPTRIDKRSSLCAARISSLAAAAQSAAEQGEAPPRYPNSLCGTLAIACALGCALKIGRSA